MDIDQYFANFLIITSTPADDNNSSPHCNTGRSLQTIHFTYYLAIFIQTNL